MIGRWDNKIVCIDCGTEFQQRFLGLPSAWCADCASRHTPVERWGCLLAIPIAITLALLSGTIGFYVGQLINPLARRQDLGACLAFIAGCDAAGLTLIYFIRPMMFPKTQPATVGRRWMVIGFFAFVAARSMRGTGLGVVLLSAFLNAAFVLPIVFYLIPIDRKSMSGD